jgi:uncharacterized protein (TIGR02996 family)
MEAVVTDAELRDIDRRIATAIGDVWTPDDPSHPEVGCWISTDGTKISCIDGGPAHYSTDMNACWRMVLATGLMDDADGVILTRNTEQNQWVVTRYKEEKDYAPAQWILIAMADTVSGGTEGCGGVMTTEDYFWQMLADNPDDSHTRLVFADWLEERGDDRAEGMRALGELKIRPHYYTSSKEYGYDMWPTDDYYKHCELPIDWFRLMQEPHTGKFWGGYVRTATTVKGIESSAAIAFGQLPVEQQQKYLRLAGAAT